jgi:NAD(P)-dependent dehydrogenase (short-subunit alcohol dehydrogenase family)
MSGSAIVLGSRPGSRNIGDIIARHLQGRGWIVHEDDCHVEGDYYRAPQQSLSEYDACVITLGTTQLTPFRETVSGAIERIIQGTLVLPLECARCYVEDRKTNGKIIFIGSYAHDHALTQCAAYCAAKAGLAHAVEELGWELTPDFLTWIIHPYHVPSTPMGKAVVDGLMDNRDMTREEAERYQKKDLKIHRHLRPQDIAKVAVWLLNNPSATQWLSGQGLNLYGGVR